MGGCLPVGAIITTPPTIRSFTTPSASTPSSAATTDPSSLIPTRSPEGAGTNLYSPTKPSPKGQLNIRLPKAGQLSSLPDHSSYAILRPNSHDAIAAKGGAEDEHAHFS